MTDTLDPTSEKPWPEPPLSEEDAKWLAALPDKLQPIAKRHGRLLFQLAMQSGILGHSLGVILRQGRGNRAILQAISVIQHLCDALVKQALAYQGKTPKDLMACRQDIELIHDLSTAAQQPGDRVSRGGIILDS